MIRSDIEAECLNGIADAAWRYSLHYVGIIYGKETWAVHPNNHTVFSLCDYLDRLLHAYYNKPLSWEHLQS